MPINKIFHEIWYHYGTIIVTITSLPLSGDNHLIDINMLTGWWQFCNKQYKVATYAIQSTVVSNSLGSNFG